LEDIDLLQGGEIQFMEFINDVRKKFIKIINDNFLDEDEKIQIITARQLTPEEAIGNPDRNDFPLLKGKEFMIQASFKEAYGQAFTDMPGYFNGTLKEVLNLKLINNYERAIFIATLNAVMRYLKFADKTIHCRGHEPTKCASQLVEYIKENFKNPRIAFIGLQPAMVCSLASEFQIRVTDLDPDNLGQYKCGVLVEDVKNTQDIIEWGDIILATGTTSVNDTLYNLLRKKPVIFYGVTISGISAIENYVRYCPFGH